MLSINSFKTHGLEAVPVTVETEITPGIGIHLVGLHDEAVRESLLRVITAMEATGYRTPGKKIVINLAPVSLQKLGNGAYDLPIALGIIGASGQEALPGIGKYVIAGELALDGKVREIPGWIQAAELAAAQGKSCILPIDAAQLAANALGEKVKVYGVRTLSEAVSILNGAVPAAVTPGRREALYPGATSIWDSVAGQHARALEIAVAGGHPLLLMGAPGSGKDLLALAVAEILPELTEEEDMEIQRIHSAARLRIAPGVRPVRVIGPGHSIVSTLGGGAGENILPGAVSLAHGGVLLVEHLPEFPKHVLEALRGPLEDGKVVLARYKGKVEYPARFFPVFVCNPCPCGYYGEGDRCTCTVGQRSDYLSHISGPVADMITVQVFTRGAGKAAESLEVVRNRVGNARAVQLARQGKLNDELTSKEEIFWHCPLTDGCNDHLERIIDRLELPARAYTRIIKIARTIADIEGCEEIRPEHISEAAAYRFLDRMRTA